MNKYLPQHVGRFEVNRDMMFMEDPPESLRYPQNRGNDDVGEDITKTTQRMGL